ncbi:peptidase [Paractinoplanes abujensis]|uniref:Pimeloyl-ACP methyl ester carboxylesterase n=1 Tax=Paractinoplanes abujensis TaxID=882441 RepID=A0A7W7D2H7_9ACTN|nr:alpha/beta fold hydrolase [Actinoplanes abujensis]MBB4697611.1 pimeloyl-ACP methyl ester carboxylesterase [Actinoplanes abujensis]GID19899.1 peptidase [Actinoplanes abujensis]
MPRTHRLLTIALAGALVTGSAFAGAAPAAAGRAPSEARLVDAVPTPKLNWYKCYEIAECATVRLPLDYRRPKGKTTEIAVLRVKAKNQAKRIGSLFVNPGGPGGSATQFALAAPDFLSDALTERFDVVGVDPRGIGASEQVKCFPTVRAQTEVLNLMNVPFPVTGAEERNYIAGSKKLGRACSTTGRPLTAHASTAEVARDMDVVRRAVGDKKLSYLGFSYGSALGQYYANMFPDRFRALVVDGVLDPTAWVGTTRQILDQRLRSSDGAYKALHEILVRCDKAGESKCVFAEGNPVQHFDQIAERLKTDPLDFPDGAGGTIQVTYAVFISAVLSTLYSTEAGEGVTQLAAEIATAQEGGTTAPLLARVNAAKASRAYDFPYENGFEASSTVICTDGKHPADASSWPAAVDRREREAKYFGRSWGWIDSQCANKTWTVQDKNAYTGPFTKRTATKFLIVGNFWDPATNYRGAVSSRALAPNASLLSSNNWGHTAYGSGVCATTTIDNYLLTGKAPQDRKTCTDAAQPFTEPLPAATATTKAATAKQRPPVATIRPDSILVAN